MKILMINVVCGIRSTGRICTDLATALIAQGHEVMIAYGREEVPEQFRNISIRIGSDVDIIMHGILARTLDAAGLGSRKATERFVDWIKQYDPDVIHLHNLHGYYINIEVLFNYLRTCSKKIIWTLHDCWAFTGHAAYCDAVCCNKWKTGCYECPNTQEYPKSLIDRSKQNWMKKKRLLTGISNLTIVTPSYWLERLVKESFLAEYSTIVINNGIDITHFYPMKNDFREFYNIIDKFVILGIVASRNEDSSFLSYLKLAEMLGREYQVVLVGLTQIQIKQIPANVIGIENTNSTKELEYISAAADLCVMLSSSDKSSADSIKDVKSDNLLILETNARHVLRYDELIVSQDELTAVSIAIKDFRNSKAVDKHSDISDAMSVDDYQRNIKSDGYWKYKKSLNLIGKKVLLGVAAVWDRRKGLQDIIELSGLITNDSRIIVVGLSSDQMAELPRDIIGYRRTSNVDELRKLYAVCDYYINPTYEDNFPSTIIEALACGTPVITYCTGGCGEVVDDNCGRVISVGNISELLKQTNVPYSERLCRNTSINYTPDKSLALYERLYRRGSKIAYEE